MREISLDTETTGLDPNSGHRIVEIGCVEMIDHIATGNSFHCYLNPERDMPPEAENVHGLSSSFLADKPLFRNVAGDLLDFLADSRLVIHNAAFDMKFLNWELKQVGIPEIPMARTLDTVQMARKKFPGQPANLDALCRRFNIDLSARTKHGALLDAELLADVYLELMGGRQSTMSLELAVEQKTVIITTDSADSEQESITIEARAFAPSAEEKARHTAFLETLNNPIWQKIAEG
jgi:DNA polymerase-3 subunit epsilon